MHCAFDISFGVRRPYDMICWGETNLRAIGSILPKCEAGLEVSVERWISSMQEVLNLSP